MTKTRIPGVAVAGWRRRLIAGSADRGLAVVAALVAVAAAPVAAQDDDYVLGQLTPAYTQGPFFVAAYNVAEECGPSEASMERIIEGELLRAGMETGPNEHAVVISASTTGYEMESRGGRNRGCAVSVQTEVRVDALSTGGYELRAVLLTEDVFSPDRRATCGSD